VKTARVKCVIISRNGILCWCSISLIFPISTDYTDTVHVTNIDTDTVPDTNIDTDTDTVPDTNIDTDTDTDTDTDIVTSTIL